MSRTPLKERKLPDYTRKEEIINMITHIVGGAFGIITLVLCVVFSALHHNFRGLWSGLFYGLMMVLLYTVSSVYHGLRPEGAKKVFQVIDHCTIYALIAGTYAPVLFTGLYDYSFRITIIVTLIVAVGSVVGVVFTAIDFHKFAIISYACYFVVGWSAIFLLKPIYNAYSLNFVLLIVLGGAVYTLGMIFFTIGIKKRYYHSIFHVFILLGSIIQFIPIFRDCICR